MKKSFLIILILMVATFCLADMVYQNTSGKEIYIGDGEFLEASATVAFPYFVYDDNLELVSVEPDNVILAADKVTDADGTAATPTYHIANITELADTDIVVQVISGEAKLYFNSTDTTAVTITEYYALNLDTKWFNKLIFEMATPTTLNYTVTKKF